MSQTYLDLDVGTTVHLTVKLTTNSDLVDSSVVTLQVKSPTGLVSNIPVAHDGVGNYSADAEVTVEGEWWYRWESADPVAAKEGVFVVRHSHVS